jgi:hypothetical protein
MHRLHETATVDIVDDAVGIARLGIDPPSR